MYSLKKAFQATNSSYKGPAVETRLKISKWDSVAGEERVMAKVEDEVREVARGQTMQGLNRPLKDFAFYSKCGKKPLEVQT